MRYPGRRGWASPPRGGGRATARCASLPEPRRRVSVGWARVASYEDGPPFGWKVGDDDQLVPVPVQQDALTTMRALRAEGLSLRSVADRMAAAGVGISHMGVKKALLARGAGQ